MEVLTHPWISSCIFPGPIGVSSGKGLTSPCLLAFLGGSRVSGAKLFYSCAGPYLPVAGSRVVESGFAALSSWNLVHPVLSLGPRSGLVHFSSIVRFPKWV